MARYKLVNGDLVQMTAPEEAAFLASGQRTVAQAKAQAKQSILARMRTELDEDTLLELANPATRITAVRQNARTLWTTVKAAGTVEAVDAVDLTAGW